jgi:multiple sugar transport system permease protein
LGVFEWSGTVRARQANLLSGLLWTAPWWLGFVLLLAYPMLRSLYISFCDYSLLQPPVYTGDNNYRALAADPVFWKVVGNTLLYSLLAVPIGTIVAVGLALLLNQRVRGQGFYRACIFLPTIVPLTAAAVVWMWMLNGRAGIVNVPWFALGATPPNWLNEPVAAMGALVLISLWFVGSPTVIFLAGLQEIPEELYEAAKIDGASAPRRFWHVTLPGLSPVVLFNVIIAILTAWQIFALPYILWRGQPGPSDATYFYTMYLFDNAFRYLKMGYASAMAWIQLLIILIMTALVFLVGRRTVHYRGA